MKKLVFYIFLLFVAFASCKDDEITTDPQYKLEYSADTISFDTILGGLTTPYQTLKVYNKSGEKIKISSINYASSNDYLPYSSRRKPVITTLYGYIFHVLYTQAKEEK